MLISHFAFSQKVVQSDFENKKTIPLDSIKKQPILNEFLLGSWSFHAVNVEEKSIEKVLTENSRLLEFKFYIDHQMRWVDDQDTANVYWDFFRKEEGHFLNIYQPLEGKLLHPEPAILKVLKLKKNKLVIQMTYEGIEQLKNPFQIVFKRKRS